jgi:hypothetical protein
VPLRVNEFSVKCYSFSIFLWFLRAFREDSVSRKGYHKSGGENIIKERQHEHQIDSGSRAAMLPCMRDPQQNGESIQNGRDHKRGQRTWRRRGFSDECAFDLQGENLRLDWSSYFLCILCVVYSSFCAASPGGAFINGRICAWWTFRCLYEQPADIVGL